VDTRFYQGCSATMFDIKTEEFSIQLSAPAGIQRAIMPPAAGMVAPNGTVCFSEQRKWHDVRARFQDGYGRTSLPILPVPQNSLALLIASFLLSVSMKKFGGDEARLPLYIRRRC